MLLAQGWGDNQFGQFLADNRGSPVPKSLFRLRVKFDDISRMIDGNYGIERRIEDRRLTRLAVMERCFSPPSLAAHFHLTELARYRWDEPLDVSFD